MHLSHFYYISLIFFFKFIFNCLSLHIISFTIYLFCLISFGRYLWSTLNLNERCYTNRVWWIEAKCAVHQPKRKSGGKKNLQGVIFKIMTAINKVLPERLCNFLVLLLHLPPVCLKPFTCHCHSSSIQTCQRCSHSHIASTACFSGTHGPVMIFVGGGGAETWW